MKIGVVNTKSFMTSGYRIDPDIHLSEGAAVRKQLRNLPYELTNVGECASKVFLGNIFSRIFVKDKAHGVPYLAASDTVLSNIETGRFLAKKQANELSYLMLKKDWILITCSGTLGNVTYTNSTFENHLATHDLIRVVPNDVNVNKGTLYAFLAGKYGYYQITQSHFGGVVKHINDAQASSIIVPILPEQFQHEINNLVQESARLKDEASEALIESTTILNELYTATFHAESKLSCQAINVSSLLSSLKTRLDPPVYINDGVKWIKNVPNSIKLLKDCDVDIWYPGMFKRAYVQDGLPYMKGSDIFLRNPFKLCAHLSKTRTPMLDQLWLDEGMILISCAGNCGQVKLITKEYVDKGAIGSPDIIRIKSNDTLFTAEYLFAYLSLPAVYDYMQSLKYGSVIERFDAEHAGNIPIIEPTKELSKKITAIIRRYMDCSYRAFIAEEKAISMVEQEIEKWNK
jgi:hypothetical protein